MGLPQLLLPLAQSLSPTLLPLLQLLRLLLLSPTPSPLFASQSPGGSAGASLSRPLALSRLPSASTCPSVRPSPDASPSPTVWPSPSASTCPSVWPSPSAPPPSSASL